MVAPHSAFIVATEASADQHGAGLVRALKGQTELGWFGVGGDSMQAAGVELQAHAREFSVLGIFEVVKHYPRLYGVTRRVLREVDRRKPKIAVLLDSPGVNLHLSRQLHKRGILVVYFIAPQLWAWRPRRIKYLQRFVRKLLCIFPFEEEYFRSRGVDTEYVGHPLAGVAQATETREQFCGRVGLDPKRPLVTLMPGSRNQEVRRHLPKMLIAARRLQRDHGASFCLIQPVTDTVDSDLLAGILARAPKLSVKLVKEPPYNALAASDAAAISSGTATVEALLTATPMVTVYRVSAASWAVGRLLVRTPHYSMVNLIAGERLVPELIQGRFTAENLVTELGGLLSDKESRGRIQHRLGEVRSRLGSPGAIGRAAASVAAVLDEAQEAS